MFMLMDESRSDLTEPEGGYMLTMGRAVGPCVVRALHKGHGDRERENRQGCFMPL